MAILYATSLGISTCWYGHYTLEELERIMPHLGNNKNLDNPKWGYGKGVVEGERAICISPLGYWKKEGLRLTDRITGSFMSYKRKEIDALLDGEIKEESLAPEILYALDLARKAPSGANSQHWRFKVSSDLKTISIAMPVGYKHIKWEHPDVDIGICACHFWLGLMGKDIKSKVSVNEEEGRAIWRFEI
jgi:nitroreductase